MAFTNLPSPQKVYIGLVPCNGPKAVPIPLNFAAASQYEVDATNLNLQDWIEAVQSIYIDNKDNNGAVIVTCRTSNQVLTVPAGAQAYLPVLQPNPPDLNFVSLGSGIATIQLMNFYMPPLVWYPYGEPNGVPVVVTALSTTLKQIVVGPAVLDAYSLLNPNATIAFIQLFDTATAAAVTLGTTLPTEIVPLGIGATAQLSKIGSKFVNGIFAAATTTATGNTALGTALDTNWVILK